MATNVFIDGFNFYYGCFKNRRDPTNHERAYLKWVDLRKLTEAYADGDIIDRIYYCTAKAVAMRDKDTPHRQRMYFDALKTISGIEIHLGQYKLRTKRGVLVNPAWLKKQYPKPVDIESYEEKGSDVNLASLLLRDAFTGKCDKAIVISNDSDLALAVRFARDIAGIPVYVLSPFPGVVSELAKAASNATPLDKSLLAHCQLPDEIWHKGKRVAQRPRPWRDPNS
jgi:uncharacterized LabA/DUF88 family protein